VHFVAAWVNLGWGLVVPSAMVSDKSFYTLLLFEMNLPAVLSDMVFIEFFCVMCILWQLG
jgi:hypothetical protein